MPSAEKAPSPPGKDSKPTPDQVGAEGHTPVAGDADTREAMIRRLAYSFYERRDFVAGHELEDWRQAEAEVDRQLAAAKSTTQNDPVNAQPTSEPARPGPAP